jgi:hypothetical protein
VVAYYFHEKFFAIKLLGVAVFTKILSVFTVFFLVQSVGKPISLGLLLWLVPLAFAVTLVPSINGLGIREGVYVFFLTPYIGRDDSFAISLLVLGVYVLSDVLAGLMYIFFKEFRTVLPI